MQYFEWVDAMWYALGPSTIALSLLMVSNVPYPKSRMKAWLYGPKKGFSFLVLIGVAIAVIDQASHFSPSIVLFPIAIMYLASGPLELGYNQFVKTDVARKLPGTAEQRRHTPAKDGYPEAPGSP